MKKFLFLFFILFGITKAQFNVDATTDSIKYLVGDYITYILSFEYPEDYTAPKFAIEDSINNLIFIKELPSSKTKTEGKFSEVRKYVFSAYDSAKITIPQFFLNFTKNSTAEISSIRVNPVDIIVTTMDVNLEEDIQDVKKPVRIPFDWLFWFFVLLGILLIMAIGYIVYQKYFKKEEKKPEKHIVYVPPHRKAIKALTILEEKKLWQQGKVKEYHTEITSVIRKYFEERFNINALEVPSSELLIVLANHKYAGVIHDLAQEFFGNADMVKFAKFEPMPSINEEMMKQAYEIITKTKPVEEIQEVKNVE